MAVSSAFLRRAGKKGQLPLPHQVEASLAPFLEIVGPFEN